MSLRYIYTNPPYEYGFFILNDNGRGLEFIQADYDIYSINLDYITHCITFKDYNVKFIELHGKEASKAKRIKSIQKTLKEPLLADRAEFQLCSNGIQDGSGECEVLLASGVNKLSFYVEKIHTNKVTRDIITDQEQLPLWHIYFS